MMPRFIDLHAPPVSRSRRLARALSCTLFVVSACSPWKSTEPTEPQIHLACSALAASARHPLPSAHTSRIRSLRVEDLPGRDFGHEPNTERAAGIAMDIPAEPGMTRAFLERSIRCYRQLAAPSMDDPLLIQRANLDVIEQHGYFEISITSEESGVAHQIIAAARAQRSQPAPDVE